MGLPELIGGDSNNEVRRFTAAVSFNFATPNKAYYAYLVVMDTRYLDLTKTPATRQLATPAVAGDPDSIAQWSATYCAKLAMMGNQHTISIGCELSSYTKVAPEAFTLATPASAPLPSSITVDGKTYTAEADIIRELTPAMEGLVADDKGNYTLTVSTPNLIPYTLRTSDTLATPVKDWQTVDAWIAEVEANNATPPTGWTEKEFANDLLPCYNHLRIGEGSQIPLPRVIGEKSRFYSLLGE